MPVFPFFAFLGFTFTNLAMGHVGSCPSHAIFSVYETNPSRNLHATSGSIPEAWADSSEISLSFFGSRIRQFGHFAEFFGNEFFGIERKSPTNLPLFGMFDNRTRMPERVRIYTRKSVMVQESRIQYQMFDGI